ncbi:MAG TPA: isoamylase early set domain-containing protein [Methylomirabilota bacterium]|nr:isoamylase early set domain-containing protein [Methylomirabilota bacterium]
MKAASKSPRRSARGTRPVRLETYQPEAIDVCVAGSFNHWQPEATPLVPLGNGRWAKELTLPEGRYEYRFVVDGAWHTDPSATENAPNPFGSLNSVLTINGSV